MEVFWKNGARIKVDAVVAHKELERIRKKNGGALDAEAIVEAAKVKKCPLHDEFEWDDTIAAHQFRLVRGREIFRYLVVSYDDAPEGASPVRCYSAERQEGPKHTYSRTEDILADPDRRALLLQESLMKLMQWRRQYRSLNELAIIFRSHDELISSLGDKL